MPSQTQQSKCEFLPLCRVQKWRCEDCPLDKLPDPEVFEPVDSDELQLMDELNVEWTEKWKEKAKQ